MENKLIKEAFSAYHYAIKKNINPKDISTWDTLYKKRMQKIAGIVHDIGNDIKNLKK
jgi:hypothetical protein